jgi:hypothetical protein
MATQDQTQVDQTERKTARTSNPLSFSYCPFCGSKLEKDRFKVGTYKENVEVVCPEHGTLLQ